MTKEFLQGNGKNTKIILLLNSFLLKMNHFFVEKEASFVRNVWVR